MKGRSLEMTARPKAVAAAVAALALALVPAASAGKGPGHTTGGTGSGGTISLVLLNSTDGVAHWGQAVTFKISTTATTKPYVSLDCYQGGVWILSSTAGFFPDYPWGQTFGLSN